MYQCVPAEPVAMEVVGVVRVAPRRFRVYETSRSCETSTTVVAEDELTLDEQHWLSAQTRVSRNWLIELDHEMLALLIEFQDARSNADNSLQALAEDMNMGFELGRLLARRWLASKDRE